MRCRTHGRRRHVHALPLPARRCPHSVGQRLHVGSGALGTFERHFPRRIRRNPRRQRVEHAQPRHALRERSFHAPSRAARAQDTATRPRAAFRAAQRAEEHRLRRQLQTPRGRKVQATPVGEHRAHAGAARCLLDGPEPRAGIVRRNIDQERTVMQARIGPRACDGRAEHPGDARTHAAHQLTGRRPRIAPDPHHVPMRTGVMANVMEQRVPRQLHQHRAHVVRAPPPLVQACPRYAAAERGIDGRPTGRHMAHGVERCWRRNDRCIDRRSRARVHAVMARSHATFDGNDPLRQRCAQGTESVVRVWRKGVAHGDVWCLLGYHRRVVLVP